MMMGGGGGGDDVQEGGVGGGGGGAQPMDVDEGDPWVSGELDDEFWHALLSWGGGYVPSSSEGQ